MKFQTIRLENLQLLEAFLSELGQGRAAFRYFDKRPINITLGHLLAVLLLDDHNKSVAYGHLEREGNTLWLGIAVVESAQGRGYGRQMMQYLIEAARNLKESRITLTVDNNNERAIKLYESFGFNKEEAKDYHVKYSLNLL